MNGSAVHCPATTLREGAVRHNIPQDITVFSGLYHTEEKLKIDSDTNILSIEYLPKLPYLLIPSVIKRVKVIAVEATPEKPP